MLWYLDVPNRPNSTRLRHRIEHLSLPLRKLHEFIQSHCSSTVSHLIHIPIMNVSH